MIRILHVPSTTIYGSVELLSPSQLPRQLYNAAIAIAQITGLAYLDDYEPAWFIALFSVSSILVVTAALALSLRACIKAPLLMSCCSYVSSVSSQYYPAA